MIDSFRGFRTLELRSQGHVVLSGVPRAGRSDVISALSRVLLPESSRTSPALSDLWQTTVPSAATGGDEPGKDGEAGDGQPLPAEQPSSSVEPRPYANVEVTLTDLDPELEQLFEGFLERTDADGCAVPEDQAMPGAPWCVRLAYRLMYDSDLEALEHFYYPLASSPGASQFTRVPASTRRALPVVILKGLLH